MLDSSSCCLVRWVGSGAVDSSRSLTAWGKRCLITDARCLPPSDPGRLAGGPLQEPEGPPGQPQCLPIVGPSAPSVPAPPSEQSVGPLVHVESLCRQTSPGQRRHTQTTSTGSLSLLDVITSLQYCLSLWCCAKFPYIQSEDPGILCVTRDVFPGGGVQTPPGSE